jgi:hypothetical protein
MLSGRAQTDRKADRRPRALSRLAAARLHRVVLDDHARLPSRFFGRLTAAVLAALALR